MFGRSCGGLLHRRKRLVVELRNRVQRRLSGAEITGCGGVGLVRMR
jgi:hypothetical protein